MRTALRRKDSSARCILFSMAHVATRPVETLRDHATALEAALAVCLGDPKPRPVHKLRTETRRIEAQLLLLDQMHGLSPFRKEAAKVRKHLKKLRRAAGRVRDLDVQRKLLENEGTQPDARRDARAMANLRKQRREGAADELLAQLVKRQAKLANALEALLEALEPEAHLELAATELLAIVERQFRNNRELKVQEPTTNQLHTLRKTAKVARYLAENAPASRRAKQTAKQYESLQQAGGEWHDWMELTKEAKEELGRHHALVDAFGRKCSRHLDQFHKLLQPFRESRRKLPSNQAL
jgi:CHAD domain-containing protein